MKKNIGLVLLAIVAFALAVFFFVAFCKSPEHESSGAWLRYGFINAGFFVVLAWRLHFLGVFRRRI